MTSVNLANSDYSSKLNNGLIRLLGTAHNADVTFAVEGRLIKAHQIILSMFSTYFEELFADNPCQHPIFFMYQVSYQVMKDILRFIYVGEVQVEEKTLSTFVDTAIALKIKGLTDLQKLTTSPVPPTQKVVDDSEIENDTTTIFPVSPTQKVVDDGETHNDTTTFPGSPTQKVVDDSETENDNTTFFPVSPTQKVVDDSDTENHTTTFPESPTQKLVDDSEAENDTTTLSLNQLYGSQTQIVEEYANEQRLKLLKYCENTQILLEGNREDNNKENYEEDEISKYEDTQNNMLLLNPCEVPEDNHANEQMQVEDDTNNILHQNISKHSKGQLQKFEWLKSKNSLDYTEPQIQLPTHSRNKFKARDQHDNVFHSLDQSKKKLNDEKRLVTVTFVKTKRGKAIIVDGNRYCMCKNQTYICTKQKSRSCNAKVTLIRDGIVFKNKHVPACCLTSKDNGFKDVIEEKKIYRRITST